MLKCQTCALGNKANFIRVLDEGRIILMCLECVKRLEVMVEHTQKDTEIDIKRTLEAEKEDII